MKKIMILLMGVSMALFSDMNKVGNVVIDNNTFLQWQDNTIISGMDWESALTYCENLTLNGYSDWRLPNIRELVSIMDDSRITPSIYPIFQKTASEHYWSSTAAIKEDYEGCARAWMIDFSHGGQHSHSKCMGTDRNQFNVRCVRAGQ